MAKKATPRKRAQTLIKQALRDWGGFFLPRSVTNFWKLQKGIRKTSFLRLWIKDVYWSAPGTQRNSCLRLLKILREINLSCESARQKRTCHVRIVVSVTNSWESQKTVRETWFSNKVKVLFNRSCQN